MTMENKTEYFWIIGGGQLQVPIVEECKKIGLKTIISDLNADCVCAPLADLFVHCDIYNVDENLRHCKALLAEGKKIVGVLAAGIDAPLTMAELNMFLGLKGVSPEIASLVNNKNLFREKMKEIGVPTPMFHVIDQTNFDKVEDILAQYKFPIIVKNTDSAGSRATEIFYSPENMNRIKERFEEAIKVSRSKKSLLEEVWVGEEFTVEGIFDIAGTFYPLSITDRYFDKSYGFPIETGLRHPSALPYNTQVEMFNLAESVAKKIGIDVGIVKYDIILTPDGPRIIEMTVRMSGGFDAQYLVPLATGKNIVLAAIQTAMGQKFDPTIIESKKNLVGVTGSLWPIPGHIQSIKGIEEAKKIEGVHHIFMRYKEGDNLLPYVDCTRRTSFVIITAETEKIARNTLNKVLHTIEINTTGQKANEKTAVIELPVMCDKDRDAVKSTGKTDFVNINSYEQQEPDFQKIIVDKPWGYEFLAYQNFDVAFWILRIEKGKATSLHSHPMKRTSLMVLSGEVVCEDIKGNQYKRTAGQGMIFGKGVFHSTTCNADEGCLVLEVESPVKKHDLLRLRDGYGRAGTSYEGADKHKVQEEQKRSFYLYSNEPEKINEAGDFKISLHRFKTFKEMPKNLAIDFNTAFIIPVNRNVWSTKGDLLFEVGEVIPFIHFWGNPTVRIQDDFEAVIIHK